VPPAICPAFSSSQYLPWSCGTAVDDMSFQMCGAHRDECGEHINQRDNSYAAKHTWNSDHRLWRSTRRIDPRIRRHSCEPCDLGRRCSLLQHFKPTIGSSRPFFRFFFFGGMARSDCSAGERRTLCLTLNPCVQLNGTFTRVQPGTTKVENASTSSIRTKSTMYNDNV
jgi:hypothetical protein